jgi:Tfp pilus assembly protein PilF
MALLVIALAPLYTSAFAQAPCQEPAGRIASLDGPVQIRSGQQNTWHPAKLAEHLCKGDTIRVGELGRAAVVLANEAVMRLDQNTTMRLVDVSAKKEQRSWVDLLKGTIQAFIRHPRLLTVNTPYLNGSIEGTEFQVAVRDDSASILVQEGRILASNDHGKVAVTPGEAADAKAGAAPTTRIVVKPRDAVQWTLYYPPILASSAGQGDAAASIETLDKTPESGRDANFHLQRAALLLNVGRQDEARADIDAALKHDPNSGLAHALRAIIDVVRNERKQALAEADKAVALSDTAATRIALSYAQQADFRIEAARDTLLVAVKAHPEDALAWARLSELWLSLGNRREATAAAEKAASLQPGLGRTQSVQGFAALAEIKTAQAQAAFEKAIALDSADPLPHLGLGLAQIRQGHLEEGRGELETAVALDSNNALLRAYLGKAYFEEKRGPLDAQQFGIAQALDPLDPTSYFYNAIRLQTENQPVEALRELDASIARNDNRAVYRSRMLLDQDRAARGTSAARVYSDLGFTQLGINEATESVTTDPANASAHRFLSDTYQNIARHETARVSELEQAQMLQDVNINPIQPSQNDTSLNIVTQGGPASAGFNEFTPLFERNRAQANLSVFGGANGTLGSEAVVSGVYDKLSLSAGAFNYDTNGFRPNNDLSHEIYNLFAQVAVTPSVNLQAEFQNRNTEYGDLKMNFDPASYSANQHNTLQTDTTRLGARFDLSPRSKLLLLYNYKKVDSTKTDRNILFTYPSPPFPPATSVTQINDEGTRAKSNQYEGAFIHQEDTYNILAGAAYTSVDQTITGSATILDPLAPFPIPPFGFPPTGDSIKDDRAYAYGNFKVPSNVEWTLGLSYQRHEQNAYDLHELNPKFGVQWQINDALRLRGAYFEAMKPVLASNRTLEPTQIAGFNQYFDDVDATRSKRYGVGADWKPGRTVALGGELTRRELKSPTFPGGNVVFDDRSELTHRAYAYWTPSDQWALSGEAVYDKFNNDKTSPDANIIPASVRTVSVPLKATYFHPAGYFAGVGVTYVNQEVRRTSASSLPQGNSSFSVVDLSAGYRLPKRLGVVSLSVQNLFDRHFNYQDDSYRQFGDEPSVAPYTPERVVMGRFTLSF